MCRFPYLAVQMRDDLWDRTDVAEPASRIAAAHGLRVLPIEPDEELAQFAERAALVATFAVNHCACDWGPLQYASLTALTRDLLRATDVRRVRVGIWYTDPDAPGNLVEIDTDGLEGVDWTRNVALDVRRASHPPFPTRPLRKLR